MTEFNLFSDDIKFTYEYNKDSISFLDLEMSREKRFGHDLIILDYS